MSRIRRLSVRGIRNFGDGAEEAQVRFSRPLTLIFGPNGTGKTTIIEALKYVTCGEFPPGSERGKFFVHDPHLTENSTVRGVVKAEIIDSAGNVYTISRTISCTRTNTTMKFQTLDNTFSRKLKNTNKVVSITNRCADVDTEVTLTMNVSKPILEYVIFCHQEDLNWPFLDGKKLKERFDEIFSTSTYNKALENETKLIKETKRKIHILQEQRKNCQLAVNEVESKENNLKDHKERLERSNSKIEDINKKLEPLNNNIKKLDALFVRYQNLQAEEKKIKAQYDIYKQQEEKLKGKISTYIFEGSTEELLGQINSYDSRLELKDLEIEKAERKIKDIADKEKKVTDTLLNEKVNINYVKQQMIEQDEKIALRNQMLNETLSSWNLDNINSDISESELTVVYERLEEKLTDLNCRLQKKKVQREQEEEKLQKVVDSLRSEYSKLDSEKSLKESEIAETIQENKEMKLELEKFVLAAQKLNTIEEKIKRMQTKIDRLNEKMDVDTEKMKLFEKIKIRDETELLLNKVDEEVASLLKLSSLQAELELSKSSLSDKEKELEKLRNKHQDNMKTLFNMKEALEIKLKSKLDTVQRGLMKQIESLDRDIETQVRSATTLEATVSHIKREIENKNAEISSKRNKVALICDYKEFDETLLLQSIKVKDLEDKRGMYAHQGAAYKEYMKQLKEPDPCCPLCHRDFNEVEAVGKLLREMENEMKNHPNRLRECDKELKVQREKYDQMLQLKPVVESIIQFEEVELEKLTNNLAKFQNQLTESQANVKHLKTTKLEPENKLTMCKNVAGDIVLWDRYIDEISKLKNTIDNYHARMAAAGIETKRGLKEAQAQREELKGLLKELRDEIEKLQSSINAHKEEVNNARQEYNALHEEQLKIRAGEQKTKELRQKQNDLYAKEIRIRKSLDVLKETVTEAKSKLNSAIKELEVEKKKNSEQQEIDRQKQTEEHKRLSKLRKVQDEIEVLLRREFPKSLKSSESKIEECQKSLKVLSVEKRNLETTINDLKEATARHDVRKRELSDNLEFRKTEEIVKKHQREYLKVQHEIKSINYSELKKEYENLQTEVQSLLRNKDKLKGNKEELMRTIEQYTQELRKEEYRWARKKFKRVNIKFLVASDIVAHFEAYNKQVDRAMIEYHESRMMKINKILQQLWRIVYTGKDTTSIQIRMDATQGVGSRRRTYNYKLVQLKHGHEIDMKGRCSAGQKVLTSIIIRIALAETFCKECGILALDEPTTNLDERNADSLAAALDMIVKLRSQYQKNFQLVVISHDEKFLLKLARLSINKGFYRLYRKTNGYSSIEYTLVENANAKPIDQDLLNVNPVYQYRSHVKHIGSVSSSDEEPDDCPVPKPQSDLQKSLRTTSNPKEFLETVSKKRNRLAEDDEEDCSVERVVKRFALD